MQAISPEILLASLRDALAEHPIARKRFLDAWRETAGWNGSYAQASQRLSEWLDPNNPHRFPLEAVPDLIRALGHAEFLDPLLALETRVQREQRSREPAKVERRRDREQGAA